MRVYLFAKHIVVDTFSMYAMTLIFQLIFLFSFSAVKVVTETVERFLAETHLTTARVLSARHHRLVVAEQSNYLLPKVTMKNIYRISRNLTKFSFDISQPDTWEKTVNAYVTLVVQRTRKFTYTRRSRVREEMDGSYFVDLFNKLLFSASEYR